MKLLKRVIKRFSIHYDLAIYWITKYHNILKIFLKFAQYLILKSKLEIIYTHKKQIQFNIKSKKRSSDKEITCCVLSCGRTGTNLVLEVLSGNSLFKPSINIEDKGFFKRKIKYENGYLTKCDTIYYNLKDFKKTLEINQYLKIIWTIRDPRDIILSKIKRGQLISDGGDSKTVVADDATPEGAIKDIYHMFEYYKYAKQNYSKRLLLVKLEDIILNIENETKRMCDFLNIRYKPNMINFISRMRNIKKRQRYNKLDKSQIGLWKNWKTVYDSFFTINKYSVEDLFDRVKPLIQYFKYE